MAIYVVCMYIGKQGHRKICTPNFGINIQRTTYIVVWVKKEWRKLENIHFGLHILSRILNTVNFRFKKPWLYCRWGFRDTFQKSAFHVIWCGNILKLPLGDIFEVAELFFPDLELFFWKSARFGFFCHFGKICCWGG